MISPQQRPCLALHYVVFQADRYGLRGWRPEDGSRKNRWDTLHDTALKCVMMDGQWPSDVRITIFAGGDVVDIDGRIQSLIMQRIGRRADGSWRRAPATGPEWEKRLWQHYGIDHPGLRWRLCNRHFPTLEEAQTSCLENLEIFFQNEQENVLIIFLNYKGIDTTYEQLKTRGIGSTPRATKVLVLLGGAHGFDGHDDRDGKFIGGVVSFFQRRFRRRCTVTVSLNDSVSDDTKFTTAKVAGFISVEWMRGALHTAVAGAERFAHDRENSGARVRKSQTSNFEPFPPGSTASVPFSRASSWNVAHSSRAGRSLQCTSPERRQRHANSIARGHHPDNGELGSRGNGVHGVWERGQTQSAIYDTWSTRNVAGRSPLRDKGHHVVIGDQPETRNGTAGGFVRHGLGPYNRPLIVLNRQWPEHREPPYAAAEIASCLEDEVVGMGSEHVAACLGTQRESPTEWDQENVLGCILCLARTQVGALHASSELLRLLEDVQALSSPRSIETLVNTVAHGPRACKHKFLRCFCALQANLLRQKQAQLTRQLRDAAIEALRGFLEPAVRWAHCGVTGKALPCHAPVAQRGQQLGAWILKLSIASFYFLLMHAQAAVTEHERDWPAENLLICLGPTIASESLVNSKPAAECWRWLQSFVSTLTSLITGHGSPIWACISSIACLCKQLAFWDNGQEAESLKHMMRKSLDRWEPLITFQIDMEPRQLLRMRLPEDDFFSGLLPSPPICFSRGEDILFADEFERLADIADPDIQFAVRRERLRFCLGIGHTEYVVTGSKNNQEELANDDAGLLVAHQWNDQGSTAALSDSSETDLTIQLLIGMWFGCGPRDQLWWHEITFEKNSGVSDLVCYSHRGACREDEVTTRLHVIGKDIVWGSNDFILDRAISSEKGLIWFHRSLDIIWQWRRCNDDPTVPQSSAIGTNSQASPESMVHWAACFAIGTSHPYTKPLARRSVAAWTSRSVRPCHGDDVSVETSA